MQSAGAFFQDPGTFFHGCRMTVPDPRKLRGLHRLNLGANGEVLQQPVYGVMQYFITMSSSSADQSLPQ